jgi:hypothetical protein
MNTDDGISSNVYARIKQVNNQGDESPTWTSAWVITYLDINNTQIINVHPVHNGFFFDLDNTNERELNFLSHHLIYLSLPNSTSNFILKYAASLGSHFVEVTSNLDDDYVIRAVPVDIFNTTQTSNNVDTAQYGLTALGTDDLSDAGPWASVSTSDTATIESWLAGSVQPAELIPKITAAQITTGILAATVGITVDGGIFGGKTGYTDNTPGFFFGKHSGAYKFKIGDAAQFLQWDGSGLTVSGSLTIQSSTTGYANIGDKPTALSGINATEGTKLSGIEDNATAGADWDADLANKPTNLSGINTTEGTKLTNIEDNATAGADWNSDLANKPTNLSGINTTEGS